MSSESVYQRTKRLLVFNRDVLQDYSKYSLVDSVGIHKVQELDRALEPLKYQSMPSNLDDGDPIKSSLFYIDKEQNYKIKRIRFEDRLFPGEEYMGIDENGKIVRVINK